MTLNLQLFALQYLRLTLEELSLLLGNVCILEFRRFKVAEGGE